MIGYNSVQLMGHVVRDPEMKYIPSGSAVINFTLAVSRRFKKADGQKASDTTFVDCEAWDTGAETLAKYTKKGDPLFIVGSLKMDSWENAEGQKRNKMKVRVSTFQFLPRSSQTEAEQPQADGEETVTVGTTSDGDDIDF